MNAAPQNKLARQLGAHRHEPIPNLRRDLGARFPSLSFAPALPLERFRLDSLVVTIVSGEVPDFVRFRADWHVVSFLLKGETRANWRRGQHEIRRICRPGTVSITPAKVSVRRPAVRWCCGPTVSMPLLSGKSSMTL